MLAGSEPAPSAMQGSAKVILMRAVGSGTRVGNFGLKNTSCAGAHV